MNKKMIHDDIIRLQGKIGGIWSVIHSNNKLIESYTISGQEYNVKLLKQENKNLIEEVKEYAKEYRKLRILLNKKEQKIKPVIQDGFYEMVNGKPKFKLYSELTEKEQDKYIEFGMDMHKNFA